MKKTFEQFLQTLSNNCPDVAFEVRYWDGDRIRFGNTPPAFVLTFRTIRAAKRTLQSGSLGFGEEYMAGNITVEGDFQQLMRLGATVQFRQINLSPKTKLAMLLRHLTSRNTSKQSPKNISHHYDLGNDFYRLWLDESMTYSCAYFRKKTDTLEQAQQQKYEHICRKLELKKGETLIDVGCGWSGMLIYAACHYGVKGIGCTLSKEQFDFAKERVKREGLEKQVDILLQDYRQVTGKFDKFVSIGMFEHVGKKFIPTFMAKASALLKPGGIGLLHTIGKERFSRGDPWSLKYIFPGGYIPVLDEIVRSMGAVGLVPTDIENLRLHYAMTLNEWSKRYEANLGEVEVRFDPSFVRMWRMFLNGSAMGFRYGDLRLYQITFTNGVNNAQAWTREHLYAGAILSGNPLLIREVMG